MKYIAARGISMFKLKIANNKNNHANEVISLLKITTVEVTILCWYMIDCFIGTMPEAKELSK